MIVFIKNDSFLSIFITGHTGDYEAMVDNLERQYPSTIIVAVGFSLGGNIVTKYMGEKIGEIPRNVIGGISICQGYNAVEYVFYIIINSIEKCIH